MTEVLDFSEVNILPEDSPDVVSASGAPLKPLDITVKCNTNGDTTREHVRSAMARDLPVVQNLDANTRHAVIVGGGPSLKWNWTELFYWISEGADIFALNGTAKFLNDRCLLPTFQVMVDPREDNTAMIAKAKEYLIASQCHPAVFDALSSEHLGLFHMIGSARDLVSTTLIGGDITVGLVAPCLAYTLGYRQMHLYGYDSSYADGEHHAYNQGQTDQEQKTLEVFAESDGKMIPFTTNFAMAKQAELFPKTAELLCNAGASITVHGTGLLPTIANSLKHNAAKAAE